MQFQIRHLFVVVLLCSLLFAFWVAEYGPCESVDASYKCDVITKFPKGFDSNARYALIPESELDSILEMCAIWTDHETGAVPRPENELPELPEFKKFDSTTQTITIPRTEFRSPLLKRDLGYSEPCDCVVFWFQHENGGSCTMMRYRHSWKDSKAIILNPEPAMIANFKTPAN